MALVMTAAASHSADAQTRAAPGAPDHGAETAQLIHRAAAEGKDTGNVIFVTLRPGAAMPRTAQATLECSVRARRAVDCRVLSESHPGFGIGESLIAQSNLVWMGSRSSASDGTVHLLFDIAQGAARIGRSDPPGALLLWPRAQPDSMSGFRRFDQNRDGHLDEREVRAIDADADGFISRGEFEQSFHFEPGGPGRSYLAFDATGDGRLHRNEIIDRYRATSIEDLAPPS